MRFIYVTVIYLLGITGSLSLACSAHNSVDDLGILRDEGTAQPVYAFPEISILDIFDAALGVPTISSQGRKEEPRDLGAPGGEFDPLKFPEVPEVDLRAKEVNFAEELEPSGATSTALQPKPQSLESNSTCAQENREVPEDHLGFYVFVDGPGGYLPLEGAPELGEEPRVEVLFGP